MPVCTVITSPGCARCAAVEIGLKGFEAEPSFASRPGTETWDSVADRERARQVAWLIRVSLLTVTIAYSVIGCRSGSFQPHASRREEECKATGVRKPNSRRGLTSGCISRRLPVR